MKPPVTFSSGKNEHQNPSYKLLVAVGKLKHRRLSLQLRSKLGSFSFNPSVAIALWISLWCAPTLQNWRGPSWQEAFIDKAVTKDVCLDSQYHFHLSPSAEKHRHESQRVQIMS